jgi:hypothetical protein
MSPRLRVKLLLRAVLRGPPSSSSDTQRRGPTRGGRGARALALSIRRGPRSGIRHGRSNLVLREPQVARERDPVAADGERGQCCDDACLWAPLAGDEGQACGESAPDFRVGVIAERCGQLGRSPTGVHAHEGRRRYRRRPRVTKSSGERIGQLRPEVLSAAHDVWYRGDHGDPGGAVRRGSEFCTEHLDAIVVVRECPSRCDPAGVVGRVQLLDQRFGCHGSSRAPLSASDSVVSGSCYVACSEHPAQVVRFDLGKDLVVLVEQPSMVVLDGDRLPHEGQVALARVFPLNRELLPDVVHHLECLEVGGAEARSLLGSQDALGGIEHEHQSQRGIRVGPCRVRHAERLR